MTPMTETTETAMTPDTPSNPPTEGVFRPRKAWLAATLSFLATGLGQLYNGQWKKGLVLLGVDFVMNVAAILMLGGFALMIAGLSAVIAFNLWAAWEAYRTARGLKAFALGPYNRFWAYATFFVVSATAGAMVQVGMGETFYRSFAIPSGSMIPTLLPGDRIMVKNLKAGEAVERGDLAVFFHDEKGVHFVKRVIGLPGETLRIDDKRVFIDGVQLNEPYVHHTKFHSIPIRDNFGPLALGPDEYFLMGDNRESSLDSRWLGPVRRDAVTGKPLFVVFPGKGLGERWSRLGAELR